MKFKAALRNAAATTLLRLVQTAKSVRNTPQKCTYRERTPSPDNAHSSTTYMYDKHMRVPCICRCLSTTHHAQVLDEPAADQSDATVLELQLRAISKKQHGDVAVRCDSNSRFTAQDKTVPHKLAHSIQRSVSQGQSYVGKLSCNRRAFHSVTTVVYRALE